jgi:predicted nucleic acid-binding protein
MELVVDSNICITYYWKEAFFRKLLPECKFFTPMRALEEIQKHEDELLEKTGLSKAAFQKMAQELAGKIEVIRHEQYKAALKEASRTILQTEFLKDEKAALLDDIAFIGLAHELRRPLWSNDRLLKKQEIVAVLNTREVIELLG